MASKDHIEYPSDREIIFTRAFDAPREVVWEVWTNPRHVALWWGPKGFTNTIHEMDVRPGGLWRLTMHGPDGTDYPNRIEFLEVVKPERLVFHHGDDTNPQQFYVTVNFVAVAGRTKIVHRMAFKTAEQCTAIKQFAADGHQSTMDRLEAFLAQQIAAAHEITNTRVFKVPRERVFDAFADPAQLAQWWGPKGFTNTIHAFDLRPGGRWRLVMHGPNGANYENESEFLEVVRPERIVLMHLEPHHQFQMAMTFDGAGDQTTLTWRMRFDCAEEVTKLKAFILEANEQNFDRLAAVLTQKV